MYPLKGPASFPRNAWYVAAWSAELGDGLLARTLLGTPVVLFRDAAGKAAALDDRCPHRRYPLSKGTLEKGVLTCGYHGYSFDGSGACVRVPALQRPVSGQRAASFPVRETWNWVWIWMGDPALADSVPLPDPSYVHADDPDWMFAVGGVETLKARHMLLHENILDLSHLTFLHATTVGSPGIAAAKLRVTDMANGLALMREVLGDAVEGTPLGQALEIEGPTDRIMEQFYIAPCLHTTGPKFRSAKDGGSRPGHVFGAFRVIHAIVPETATSSHYFWGFTRNFRKDDDFTSVLHGHIRAAVQEDIDASEDIERMIEPDARAEEDINSPADAAAVKGRRIMQRLIDAEHAPALA